MHWNPLFVGCEGGLSAILEGLVDAFLPRFFLYVNRMSSTGLCSNLPCLGLFWIEMARARLLLPNCV